MSVAWKQFAQTFLRSMAKEAVPVTRAVEYLRAEKISFRYAEMLKYYRTYSKQLEVVDRYKYIPKKYCIPPEMIARPHPFQSKDYLYEGSVKIRVRATGYEALVPSRVSSDFNLSRGRAEEELMEVSRREFDAYGIDVVESELTGTFGR